MLRQALEALAMTPEVQIIVEFYRRHERCFGNYVSIAECQKYCEAYMEQPDSHKHQPTWQQGNNKKMPAYQKPEKKPTIKSSKKPVPTVKKSMPPVKKSMPPSCPGKEAKESSFKYSCEFDKCIKYSQYLILPLSVCLSYSKYGN